MEKTWNRLVLSWMLSAVYALRHVTNAGDGRSEVSPPFHEMAEMAEMAGKRTKGGMTRHVLHHQIKCWDDQEVLVY